MCKLFQKKNDENCIFYFQLVLLKHSSTTSIDNVSNR